MTQANRSTIRVTVELFGRARSAAGVMEVDVRIPPESASTDLAQALAVALPDLKGVAIAADGSDLLPSYTANVGGMRFLTEEPISIRRGETVFLFSSQAGGK